MTTLVVVVAVIISALLVAEILLIGLAIAWLGVKKLESSGEDEGAFFFVIGVAMLFSWMPSAIPLGLFFTDKLMRL